MNTRGLTSSKFRTPYSVFFTTRAILRYAPFMNFIDSIRQLSSLPASLIKRRLKDPMMGLCLTRWRCSAGLSSSLCFPCHSI
ncbi:hypothetical protein BGZ60DRAFT_406139 [Tricladium varicosporioides]|nr:hypothetical protein BGZ60DRAFT_406139 [Hymenoscyphus varicosporioides]